MGLCSNGSIAKVDLLSLQYTELDSVLPVENPGYAPGVNYTACLYKHAAQLHKCTSACMVASTMYHCQIDVFRVSVILAIIKIILPNSK